MREFYILVNFGLISINLLYKGIPIILYNTINKILLL